MAAFIACSQLYSHTASITVLCSNNNIISITVQTKFLPCMYNICRISTSDWKHDIRLGLDPPDLVLKKF